MKDLLVLIKLVILTIVKIIILLSSVYSFLKSGSEFSCFFSRPGTIQHFINLNGFISKISISLKDYGEVKQTGNVFCESIYGMEGISTSCIINEIQIKNEGYYYTVSCRAVDLNGTNYLPDSALNNCRSNINVYPYKFNNHVTFRYHNYSSCKVEGERVSSLFTCKAEISEENCKVPELFNNVYFLLVVVLLLLNTFCHCIVYFIPVKVMNNRLFKNSINLYIKINNYLGFCLPSRSTFCYDINGELYVSIEQGGSCKKVLEMGLTYKNKLTSGWGIYKDISGGRYLIDVSTKQVFDQNDKVIAFLKNDSEVEAVMDIFWYHEFLKYPVVHGDHCLNISEIMKFISQGFKPQYPKLTGITYKNKDFDVDEAIMNLVKSSLPKDLVCKLFHHNKIFFGCYSPAEYFKAMNKKLSFGDRPYSCSNSKWKMYGSDVSILSSDYGIILKGINKRKETPAVKKALEVFNSSKDKNLAKNGTVNFDIDFSIQRGNVNVSFKDGNERLNLGGEEEEMVIDLKKINEITDDIKKEEGDSSKCYPDILVERVLRDNKTLIETLESSRKEILEKYPEVVELNKLNEEKEEEFENRKKDFPKPVLNYTSDLKIISDAEKIMVKKNKNFPDSVQAKYRGEARKFELNYNLTDKESVTETVQKILKFNRLNNEVTEIKNRISIVCGVDYLMDRNVYLEKMFDLTTPINNFMVKIKENDSLRSKKSTSNDIKIKVNSGLVRVDLDKLKKEKYKVIKQSRIKTRVTKKSQKKFKNREPKEFQKSVICEFHKNKKRSYHNIETKELIMALSWFKLQGNKPGVKKLLNFIKNCRKNTETGEMECSRWIKNTLWKVIEVVEKEKMKVSINPTHTDQKGKGIKAEESGGEQKKYKIEFNSIKLSLLNLELSKALIEPKNDSIIADIITRHLKDSIKE